MRPRCFVLVLFTSFILVRHSWRARKNTFGPANGYTHASKGKLMPGMANTLTPTEPIVQEMYTPINKTHIEEREKGP